MRARALNIQTWTLAEDGDTRTQELVRRAVRRYRGVPSLGKLRRQGMVIGRNVSAEPGVKLEEGLPWLVEIGDDVTFSLDVIVLAHDASTTMGVGAARLAAVSIGSRVFVGARAVILPGTTIGDDCVIGAGAVVKGKIPSDSVVAGVPARVVAQTSEYVAKHRQRAANAPRWGNADADMAAIGADDKVAMRLAVQDREGYLD